jgi:hypothetical protein
MEGGMPTGFDTPANCSNQIQCIKQAGHAFVGRYLSKSSWKVIGKAEADALRQAGLAIVLVYEDGPTAPTYFSFGRGQTDGARAANQANALGAPDNTTIYFAVDYDASEDDVDGVITQYFQGVISSLRSFAASGNPQYRVGIYGSGATCGAITAAGLASMGWLACASAWRGHDKYTDWSLLQNLPHTVCGLDADPDRAIDGDYGAFSAAPVAVAAAQPGGG